MPRDDTNPLVEGKKKYPPKVKIPRKTICQGIKDIEDIHPLRKTVAWAHVAGCCKVVCCCAKKKKPFA